MLNIIFPGQGSQAPGMGQFLYENFAVAKQCFEEASDTISLDFKKLCFEGSEADLALTENTQPALVLVSTALFRTLGSIVDLKPAAFAGHSVGEYSALVAAGGVSFSDAVTAVRKRGQAMQQAVPVGQGGMLAIIGPVSSELKEVCLWAEKESGESPIAPANYNTPTQTVVSGNKKAIDWLHENLKSFTFVEPPKRLMSIPLKVSAPFHCKMMQPAEVEMAEVLSKIEFVDIKTPVVQNYVAESVLNSEKLRKNLISQVTGPVRWVESIEWIKREFGQGADTARFLECGVGKVLAGLNKKIDKSLKTLNVNSLEELKAVEETLS